LSIKNNSFKIHHECLVSRECLFCFSWLRGRPNDYLATFLSHDQNTFIRDAIISIQLAGHYSNYNVRHLCRGRYCHLLLSLKRTPREKKELPGLHQHILLHELPFYYLYIALGIVFMVVELIICFYIIVGTIKEL
jgi:hypothetical protein